MSYSLAEQVSFCVADGKPIFLDIRRDRYFRLGTKAESAFRSLTQAQPVDASAASLLMRLGIVAECADGLLPIRPATATPPTRSTVEHDKHLGSATPRVIIGVCWSLQRAWVDLRLRPLERIIGDLRGRRHAILQKGSRSDHGALAVAAASFNAVRGFIPVEPLCLLDSLAMLYFLQRRRFEADMVFGVALNPFGAHCWLQDGDTVLNDALDNATAHTPILVV